MAALIIAVLQKQKKKKEEDKLKELQARQKSFVRQTFNDYYNEEYEEEDDNYDGGFFHDDLERMDEPEEQDAESKVEVKQDVEDVDESGIKDVLPYQFQARTLYDSPTVQIGVALAIFVNFMVNAAEAQDMSGKGVDVWPAFELFFTAIFTVELLFNMYAFFWTPFWSSTWNVFDFVVVVISLMSLALDGLPGISTLRLMRAFRVFRLFKRMASLRKILVALEAAVPGCSNAFLILILVSSIYSILGVEFFSDISPEFFKNFLTALFTMFQIMTGDSWGEIARPIIDEFPHAAIFFVTYILIANIVLVNVIIAALLEEMVGEDAQAVKEEAEKEKADAEEKKKGKKESKKKAKALESEREAREKTGFDPARASIPDKKRPAGVQMQAVPTGQGPSQQLQEVLTELYSLHSEFKTRVRETNERLVAMEQKIVSHKFDSGLQQLQQRQSKRGLDEEDLLQSRLVELAERHREELERHNERLRREQEEHEKRLEQERNQQRQELDAELVAHRSKLYEDSIKLREQQHTLERLSHKKTSIMYHGKGSLLEDSPQLRSVGSSRMRWNNNPTSTVEDDPEDDLKVPSTVPIAKTSWQQPEHLSERL